MIINAIMSLYSESTFIVKDKFSTSSTHVQSRGVRQGCPMSPYLFCMVLSCLMKDVDDQLLKARPTLPSTFSSKCPFWDLEYADDTVLISNTFQIIDEILQILEPKANDIGLSLNLDKCEHLRLNSNKDVHFSSGTTVPVKHSVKYLGVILRPNGSSREDVTRRLTLARTAFKMLLPFSDTRAWDGILYIYLTVDR